MSCIQIRPVRTKRDRRTVLTFHWRIYRDDPLGRSELATPAPASVRAQPASSLQL